MTKYNWRKSLVLFTRLQTIRMIRKDQPVPYQKISSLRQQLLNTGNYRSTI